MQQKLILPLNRTLVTASMGNAAYRAKFGFPHYGTDMVSAVGDTTIYASGTGTLIAAGWDKYAGNVVVIRYPGGGCTVRRHSGGRDLPVLPSGRDREDPRRGKCHHQGYHSGRYGGSGMGSKSYWSPHLHVEADTDVRYPRYSPTFTPSGEILFGRAAGATAATLRDCLDYLYRKTSGTRPSDLPDGRCALCGSEGLCHSGAA